MKPDINRIYDIIEAKVTEQIGMRPNATDKDLGIDSLDFLEIRMELEEHYHKIKKEKIIMLDYDMSVLEMTLLFYELLKEYEQDT